VDTIATSAELRERLDRARCDGRTVGLVPTMGYLHEGHTSLMERSVGECDLTVATIFVNPLQFAPGEDLAEYPRDLTGDTAKADAAGVDILFTPGTEEMYPEGEVLTTVSVGRVSDGLEGESRPAHFAGVATVVAKLFAIAGPCRAYFGEKDYQQLLVVRRLVHDLSFPVEVVGCTTVREHDGLALSSRNVYLSGEEREAATVLYTALRSGQAAIAAGEVDALQIEQLMADIIDAEPRAALDYAVVRNPDDLSEMSLVAGEVRLLVAAKFTGARLLDNLGAHAP
jgi:pantoate--beta-alanine ligase